jgi:hypothetical protein
LLAATAEQGARSAAAIAMTMARRPALTRRSYPHRERA